MAVNDATNARADLRTISGEELKSYFDRKIKNVTCDACNVNDWLITSESADGFVPVMPSLSQENPSHITKPALSIVTAICANCGYIRSFARHYVLDQLERDKNA